MNYFGFNRIVFIILSLTLNFNLKASEQKTTSTVYRIKLNCTLENRIVPRTKEEFATEVEKMKRIHRKAEDAEDFKYIQEEVCTPIKFCEANNPLSAFNFISKKEFQSNIANGEPFKGTYSLNKSTINLDLSKGNLQKILIRSWDDRFYVRSFIYKGKVYSLMACGSYLDALKLKQKKDAELKIQALEEIKKKEIFEQRRLEHLQREKKEAERFKAQELETEEERKELKRLAEKKEAQARATREKAAQDSAKLKKKLEKMDKIKIPEKSF